MVSGERIKTIITNITVSALLIFITWQVQANWFPTIEREVVSDTLYIDKPYEVEVVKEVEIPKTVEIYKTVRDTITEIKIDKDTVFVFTDEDKFQYDSSFLTQYPEAHKLLGLVRERGQLSLTTMSPSGTTATKTWDVGDDNYRVGVNVALETWSKEPSFGYGLQAGYIQYYDLGSPFLEINGNFSIFRVDLQGTLNINKRPFVMVGVNYEF